MKKNAFYLLFIALAGIIACTKNNVVQPIQPSSEPENAFSPFIRQSQYDFLKTLPTLTYHHTSGEVNRVININKTGILKIRINGVSGVVDSVTINATIIDSLYISGWNPGYDSSIQKDSIVCSIVITDQSIAFSYDSLYMKNQFSEEILAAGVATNQFIEAILGMPSSAAVVATNLWSNEKIIYNNDSLTKLSVSFPFDKYGSQTYEYKYLQKYGVLSFFFKASWPDYFYNEKLTLMTVNSVAVDTTGFALAK
jgi:hypothetical protein